MARVVRFSSLLNARIRLSFAVVRTIQPPSFQGFEGTPPSRGGTVSGHVLPSEAPGSKYADMVVLHQSVTDGLFKAVVEATLYVFLDIVVIASRHPDIQTLERGAHGDSVFGTLGIVTAFVHVVTVSYTHLTLPTIYSV